MKYCDEPDMVLAPVLFLLI